MRQSASRPVLIAGAGPTGLVLAIELARRNVPFRLIDRLPARSGWERATVVKSRTMEILRAIGVAESIASCGRVVEGIDIHLGAAKAASYRFDVLDTAYPFMLSVAQDETERVLIERLRALGGGVERDTTFLGLEPAEGGVRARLRTGSGDETWCDAGWIVGTDGFHSAVRQAIGVEFEGRDYPRLWGVVDAGIAGWRPEPAVVAVQLQAPVVIPFPLRDGRWRIYFRPDAADRDVLGGVVARLRVLWPDAKLEDPDEPRFFHAHSRVAGRFREGRVFVAGDAAHVSNPIEGHGMNAGIQDAFNLGWKLALLMAGAEPDVLATSYGAERRDVARTILQSGDEMEARIEPSGTVAMQELIGFLTTADGQEMAAMAESELGFAYAPGALVGEIGDAPEASARLTGIGLRVGDAAGLAGRGATQGLHDLLAGPHATLLLLLGEADSVEVQRGLELLGRFPSWAWFGPQRYVVVKGGAAHAPSGAGILHDTTGDTHARLAGGRPALCLVRPDGHLALRAPPSAADEILARLRAIMPAPAR